MSNTNMPALPADDAICAEASYTCVTNCSGRLTKRFEATDEGGCRKLSEPPLYDALARRRHLPVDWAASFAADLKALTADQAIILGDHDREDEVELVSKQRLAGSPGAITRTAGVFDARPGRPGLVGIDVDLKDLPFETREKLHAAGVVVAVLEQVAPGFALAGRVVRPSVSTGIINTFSGQEYGGGGLHVYVMLKDGSKAKPLVQRLDKRLVNAGFGHVFISAAGIPFVRSIIDVPASCDAGRLWYEADAELGPRIAYRAEARTPQVFEGPALDAELVCPPLTEEEIRAYEATKAELMAAACPEAERIRTAWLDERGMAHRKAGGSISSDTMRMGDPGDFITLYGEHQVLLDDGTTASVLDIIRDPARYDGVTCADPVEWDYGGGRNKAIICTMHGPSPEIRSQAHGGQTFLLRLTAEDFLSLLKDEASHAR